MARRPRAASRAADGFETVSVFRSLNELVDAGLAYRKQLGDHVWLFEIVGDRPGEEAYPDSPRIGCWSVSCIDETGLKQVAGRKPIVGLGRVTEVALQGTLQRSRIV